MTNKTPRKDLGIISPSGLCNIIKEGKRLNEKSDNSSRALQALSKKYPGQFPGCINDEGRATGEYKRLHKEALQDFEALRRFNSIYSKYIPHRVYPQK